MDYKILEERLGIGARMDEFEARFDAANQGHDAGRDLYRLRQIKVFLYRGWDERRALFAGTALDSTDCLTLATLTNLLAARKGVGTKIARPDALTRYLHAVIIYDGRKGDEIFKVSGRNRNYGFVVLSPEDVEKRLRYTHPLFSFANALRCNAPLRYIGERA